MDARRFLEALIGVYVAMVLVPAGVLVGVGSITSRPPLGLLVGAGVAIAVIVALAARTIDDLAETSASLPVAAGSILPPLAYLPYMILATAPESSEAFVSVIGILAVLPGVAVPVGSAIVRSRRVRETATEIAVVTVGETDADSDRNWTLVAAVAVGGILFIGVGVVTLFRGDADMELAVGPLTGVWTSILLLVSEDSSEVAVTDGGLRIDRSVTTWNDLEGYRVTDETVELIRSQWYLPTRDFDREEISDDDVLVEALAEFLPRLDKHGRVEATARRYRRR